MRSHPHASALLLVAVLCCSTGPAAAQAPKKSLPDRDAYFLLWLACSDNYHLDQFQLDPLVAAAAADRLKQLAASGAPPSGPWPARPSNTGRKAVADGNAALARVRCRTIIQDFPNTTAVAAARKLLASLTED